MPSLAEQLLFAFCKLPKDVPYDDPRDPDRLVKRDVPPDALANLKQEFPNLGELLRGKDVLDFGCGFGDQASAIAREYGARVTGLDSHLGVLDAARSRYGADARFVSDLEREKFDVVISQDAMEHFGDPVAALAAMARALRPGGLILMTFGPPWFAPYGSHTGFFCRIPWVQLWFSERTVMAVRSRYRNDGATRYEEVESGLNKMSLRKFERIVAQSGLTAESRRYIGVKKLHWLTRIPLVRELTTVVVTVILRQKQVEPLQAAT